MVLSAEEIGLQVPQFLLPRPGIDLFRWAVVACDQYTSQPDYWKQVEEIVGDAPSTLHLVLPEIYLEYPDADERIRRIHVRMQEYLDQELFYPYEGLVYIERTVHGRTRRGLLACFDLEKYEVQPEKQSLARATEETIMERLPARMRIREAASLELSHVQVLIDDPEKSIIENLRQYKSKAKLLYDFDLMQNGGHLSGWLLDDPIVQKTIFQSLMNLATPDAFKQKYTLESNHCPLLFAVGDGNHSLASAKAVWEKRKVTVAPDHPARFVLVEIVNLHDSALAFKPIHRVLFRVGHPLLEALQMYFGSRFSYTSYGDEAGWEKMTSAVDQAGDSLPSDHCFGLLHSGECGLVRIANPDLKLPVETLQRFLDRFMQQGGAEKIDYVHGIRVLKNLFRHKEHAGFYLPAISKKELFRTVILDGTLPRKAFSMGDAHEKRFYMESRRIDG